jgi:hypothetical protein
MIAALRLASLLFGAVAAASCGAAGGSHPGTSRPDPVPTAAAADTFHSTIVGATGRFSGDGGSATVLLRRGPGPRSATTSVTISVHGVSCRSAQHCLHLDGRLSGQMTPQRSHPDVGHSYVLTAAGTMSPLGHVGVSGTAAGTGFIRFGHTRLTLTLRPRAGTVTLSGRSPEVPGFTQP